MVDPEEPILFQGVLQKYKPGFNANFIDRWVQVTASAFRYYTSKPATLAAAVKPLMAVPLSSIKAIERVDLQLKLKKGDTKGEEFA